MGGARDFWDGEVDVGSLARLIFRGGMISIQHLTVNAEALCRS